MTPRRTSTPDVGSGTSMNVPSFGSGSIVLSVGVKIEREKKLEAALGMSEAGWICGDGTKSRETHAYVAIPSP